jgi:hypothetical protein
LIFAYCVFLDIVVAALAHSDGSQFLYAVGGFYRPPQTGLQGTYLSSVERYNPALDIWEYVASMSVGRTDLGVATLQHADGNHFLYAVGGTPSIFASSSVSTVERYDYSQDAWEVVASMLQARSRLALAPLQHPVGPQFLYAVGGDIGSESFSSVERYSPSEDVWESVANMSTARAQPAVAAVRTLFPYFLPIFTTFFGRRSWQYAMPGRCAENIDASSVLPARFVPPTRTHQIWDYYVLLVTCVEKAQLRAL